MATAKKAKKSTVAPKAAEKESTKEMVARAKQAIHDLFHEKELVTFVSVSEKAGVSRSWLYRHADIRARLEKARDEQKLKTEKKKAARKKSAQGVGKYDAEKEEFTIRIPRGARENAEPDQEESSDFLKLVWRENELILILKTVPGRK